MKLKDKWECLIETWKARVEQVQSKHSSDARRYHRLHFWVGIPSVVFAGLGALAAFANTIVSSACATGAAILSGVQTFGDFAAKAEKHRITSARFSCLARELEQQRLFVPKSSQEAQNRIRSIHHAYSDAEGDAPITASWRLPLPPHHDLKAALIELSTSSEKVTNLGWQLWELIEVNAPDDPEPPRPREDPFAPRSECHQ